MKLLTKACELDDAQSCAVVGSFYLEKQTPDALKKAKNLFEKACRLGDHLGSGVQVAGAVASRMKIALAKFNLCEIVPDAGVFHSSSDPRAR